MIHANSVAFTWCIGRIETRRICQKITRLWRALPNSGTSESTGHGAKCMLTVRDAPLLETEKQNTETRQADERRKYVPAIDNIGTTQVVLL